MWRSLFKPKFNKELEPDEIFLDSRNLPSFDKQQFEGQIERPISKGAIYLSAIIFFIIGSVFVSRVGFLQIAQGGEFAERSVENKLRHTTIFPDRGIIYDRNQIELAWNNPNRVYISERGFAHVLGYVGFPTEAEIKTSGYHPESLIGKDGVERIHNSDLAGLSGIRIEEVNATGDIYSDHVLREPESGEGLTLSIDSRIQGEFYNIIKRIADEQEYVGGSGILMDIETGEIISLVSFPEYDSTVMSSREDASLIKRYLNDGRNPFLNRAIGGLYAPGSVIKPFMATAALNEKLINPAKQILSTGKLVIPNPYNPDEPTIFKDWKAHGLVDMRRAIAVSSNVYFYVIGGGYKDQAGLGIKRIESYARLFGFGSPTGIDLPGEVEGVIPSPDWKKETFNGEDWRLGDTYHTVIGQYGFLVSPLQVVRGISAIGNGGRLLSPTLLLTNKTSVDSKLLPLKKEDLNIILEGMRLAVTDGSAVALNVPYVKVAAKTGTAEVGISKGSINAWIGGIFPYEKPRYAFVVAMEKGRSGTVIGGGMVMRSLLDWMAQNTPEYFEVKN